MSTSPKAISNDHWYKPIALRRFYVTFKRDKYPSFELYQDRDGRMRIVCRQEEEKPTALFPWSDSLQGACRLYWPSNVE